MDQVSLYRSKSIPPRKIFQAPPDRKTLDPKPSVDMIRPVCIENRLKKIT